MTSHYVGKTGEGDVFIFVENRNGNLSVTGVIKPTARGDAASCGQINMNMHPRQFVEWAEGWDAKRLRTVLAIWERWHLNDLKAGSPVQEAFVREWKAAGKVYDYTVLCDEMGEAGLSPDADGYVYGTAWKREEVPEDVWEFLAALPQGKEPPGTWHRFPR